MVPPDPKAGTRHDNGGVRVQVRVRQVEVEVARLNTSKASDPTSRAPRRRFCSQSASEGTRRHAAPDSERTPSLTDIHTSSTFVTSKSLRISSLRCSCSYPPQLCLPNPSPLCSINTMSPKELRWGILATGKISTNFSKVRVVPHPHPHTHTKRSRRHPRLTSTGHPHRPVHSGRLGRVPPDRGGRFSERRVGAGFCGQAAQA
jgi:hypothetical protein